MHLITMIRTRLEHLLNQRRSREALEAARLKKFRSLVAYVKERSPYYAKVLAESGIDPRRCAPSDFPVLTKRELMDHFDEIVTDRTITKRKVEDFLASSKSPLELFENRYYLMHTSGSSGEVGLFVFSRKDYTRGATQALRFVPFGLKKNRIAFIGATRGHFAGVTMVSSAKRSPLKPLIDVETFEINSPLHALIERLNRFRPDVLVGYATALRILAEKQIDGSLKIAPSILQSSGESILAGDRSVIETAFHAPLNNVYACTEHLYMGIGKPQYDGMYLLEDDLIFEFHPDGARVTNLFNRTLPMIRYQMKDLLIPSADPNPLFPFTKIKEIIGRNEHLPVFTNRRGEDDFISPHIFNEIYVKHLKRFQMEIVDKKRFIFRAVGESGISDFQRLEMFTSTQKTLKAILAEKEMQNVTYDVNLVDDLPVDPKTGKFKLILPPKAP